ncbi:uncharacterized protein EDB93DRAFT_1330816 [Suillus bovinus]|uniref:uncharacterized protein n=1 Tax=Suillus bovinus TaxID=48563 RepID=UPI001B8868A5|nr:uncharacterized protein EDB93DRAFT_1330816 [Suillus bovinus]KAG2136595.1 hypothetical protein EDB93DRAFT_1330816 [Suillus bovinus]
MANYVGTNAPKTPLRNSAFSAELIDKSAPHSKCINTLPKCLPNKGTEVEGHCRNIFWIHEFKGTSTTEIRRAVGLTEAERRRCVLIITSSKFLPITTLTGNEFLVAWWKAVGIRHGDINPSNLMGYRLHGQFLSVINDFDLSSIKQFLPPIKEAPRGFERTGTVPFMSLKLFTHNAITGQVEHLYYHDAESFICVLTWICLRYENGKLLRWGRPLDGWLIEDALACYKKKTSYLARADEICPTQSHERNFKVVMRRLKVIHEQHETPYRSNDSKEQRSSIQQVSPKPYFPAFS